MLDRSPPHLNVLFLEGIVVVAGLWEVDMQLTAIDKHESSLNTLGASRRALSNLVPPLDVVFGVEGVVVLVTKDSWKPLAQVYGERVFPKLLIGPHSVLRQFQGLHSAMGDTSWEPEWWKGAPSTHEKRDWAVPAVGYLLFLFSILHGARLQSFLLGMLRLLKTVAGGLLSSVSLDQPFVERVYGAISLPWEGWPVGPLRYACLSIILATMGRKLLLLLNY